MPLNESDTRAKLIDPALHKRGWTENLIRREETAGAIEIVDGKAHKRARGRVDYLLRVAVNAESQAVAVALIEAKAENLPPTHGLEQAKLYASCKRLNVPFVFSSNRHLFVEYDIFTGKTSPPKPLAEFPTPAEVRARYEQGKGFKLDSPAARPLLVRYAGGEATRRYYQDAAIRAVLEKLNRGEKRVLLSLATGAGKTFIAVQLLKKIANAGLLKRALFLCDRDELRSQALAAFQNVFGADAAEVYEEADGKNHARNARIHIATYQTLDMASEDDTADFLHRHYPENYFSHIIIDECHRSAWGKWSEALRRNPEAVQIGLTATPRTLELTETSREAQADAEINADNLRHFGEPVYEYDMAQGIEDGYLTACEIHRVDLFLDDRPETEGVARDDLADKTLTDADTGARLTIAEARERYGAPDLEDRLLLPERVAAMCQKLFQRLCENGGPEQKTIIFCARDRHADDVAVQMNNLYADWCARDGRPRLDPYAFKCTASVGGAETYGGLFQDAPALFDVVLMNPPFGGKEGKDAQTRFAYKTSATQVLFLQHVIDSLKPGGRCGIVLDEGVLFRTNEMAFVQTKRKLLDDCDLWCIVSLPPGAFVNAGAGVKTNLLFFTKGKQTEKIWYYDLSDVKVGKKFPLTLAHFEEFLRLLPDRAESEHSWTVMREQVEASNSDLKGVNPNRKNEEDTRTPEELLDFIEEKGKEVAEAVKTLRSTR